MGAIQDLLREVPLSAVLKERVALAEQKYNSAIAENMALKARVHALEQQNISLRPQLPKQQDFNLGEDTKRVLAHLFGAEGDARDVGVMARLLQMEKGIVKYHLDELDDAGLATCTGFNTISGYVYWAPTPKGRKCAVENKLV